MRMCAEYCKKLGPTRMKSSESSVSSLSDNWYKSMVATVDSVSPKCQSYNNEGPYTIGFLLTILGLKA